MATTESVLRDLTLLYKGKRMLVVDNTERHLDEDYDIIVWDRLLGCEVGFCRYESDGSMRGWAAYGNSELTISGIDAKQLAQDTTRVVNWSIKN